MVRKNEQVGGSYGGSSGRGWDQLGEHCGGGADHNGTSHIPSDLVVDSWASSVESRVTLDFLYVPDA